MATSRESDSPGEEGTPTPPSTSPGEPAHAVDDEHAATHLAGGAGAVVGPSPFVGFGLRDAISGLGVLGRRSLRNPKALVAGTPRAAWHLLRIGTGKSPVAPEPGDKRFRDPVWQTNPLFRALMQGYLFLGHEADEVVEHLGLDQKDVEKVEFVIHLIREGLAPTNNLLTNPVALRELKRTRGRSIVRGAGHLVHDVRRNHAMPSQVNRKPFRVGENLAVTPGAVIHRTEMMEVIQYTPQTPQVYARPMLVIPPQVNKYYALDLAPGRSMYEYLLQHGIQVYGISWRNPTKAQRDWGFDAYAAQALEAVDVVREVSRSADVNVMGGCAGGMMVSILAAILAEHGDRRIHSATTLVTLLDSKVDAEILLFASPRTVAAAKRMSGKQGVLDGWKMAQVFAWLRPNELIWNYWVNNYLLGKEPPAFDILAWNADTTRLPARLHHELLEIVTENQLATPGRVRILDTPVDISAIDIDTYVVGGLTDHITPWGGCYRTTQMVGGSSEFVLCSSGHVQSLVAAPSHRGLAYYVNPATPADPDEWFAGAQRHEGTWWEHWVQWLGERSGRRRRAPAKLGNAAHPVLEKAPGTYVRQ